MASVSTSTSTTAAPPQELLDVGHLRSSEQLSEMVERILINNGSERLRDIVPSTDPKAPPQLPLPPEDRWMAYIRGHYTILNRLGKGGYGSVYKARPVVPNDPANNNNNNVVCVAIKAIQRNAILQSPNRVKHLAVELAVLQLPKHPNINHRSRVFHTDSHILVVLDLCEAPRPTVLTRLAHSLSYRKPSRLGHIDSILEQWKAAAKAQQQRQQGNSIDFDTDEEAFGDFVDQQKLFHKLAIDLDYAVKDPPEVPSSGSLFNMIVGYKRISDPMARIILKQILKGLASLHKNQVVHRDLKTENIVVAIHRHVILTRNQQGVVTGATFDEKVEVKIVDFGLAKYFLPAAPGGSGTAAAAAAASRDADQQKQQQQQGSSSSSSSSSAVKPALQPDSLLTVPPPLSTGVSPGGGGGGGGSGKSPAGDDSQDIFGASATANIIISPSTITVNKKNTNDGGAGEQEQEDDAATGKKKPASDDDAANNNNNNNRIGDASSSSSAATTGGLFPKATTSPCFPVTVTPIGTDIYLSLEALRGMLHFASMRSKWISSNKSLYKVDAYGVGTILYCMSNGKPPFRPADTYRKLAREERMRQIEELVSAGAVFLQCVSPQSKALAQRLLENEIEKRYTVFQALEDPFVKDAKDALVTEVSVTGVVSISQYDSRNKKERAKAIYGEPNAATESDEATGTTTTSDTTTTTTTTTENTAITDSVTDAENDAADEAAVGEVLRFKEDFGDGAGKN